MEACKLSDQFFCKNVIDSRREGLVASVCTEFLKWQTYRFQTHHVRFRLHDIEFMLQDSTYKLLGSDVKPCVWAVVEVCLGILGACLPTFPALFRWKTVRNSRRPSGMSHSKSTDSSQYPVLTPDERRSGFRSGVVGVGKAHKEFLRMIDWADIPKAVEKGSGVRTQEGEVFDSLVR